MIYDRVDSLHHKDDEYRSEWRKTRVPRSQVDKMEHQLCPFPSPRPPSSWSADRPGPAAKRLST